MTSDKGQLAALAGAILLSSLGISVGTVAQPVIAEGFGAALPQVQWVVTGYLLAIATTIVISGRLGDIFGSRTVLLGGLGLFVLAGAASAIAPDLRSLIAARVAQGVGGAILMALPMALVRSNIANARMGQAMGLLGAMSGIGTALGPSVGGLLIGWAGWRMAFGAVALCGVAGLLLALAFVRAPAKTRNPPALDIAGALVLMVALLGYCLAVSGGNALRWGVIAGIAVAVFVALERRHPAPLLQPAALLDAGIGAALMANIIVTMAMMATLVVGPFFLTSGLHLEAAQVGLVMAAGPVAAAMSGVPAGRLVDRLGAEPVTWLGLLQIIFGLVCFATLPQRFGVWGYIGALVVLTPGFQLFLAANTTSVMRRAPKGEQGVISGLLGLARNLGFLTGASLMGTVFLHAAGKGPLAQAGLSALGHAFAVTFLMAAALAGLALAGLWLLRPRAGKLAP